MYIRTASMIIVVAGVKGGTGKTTIATNLTVLRASTGKKVLLVDGDEQRSTSMWANQRDALGIPTNWSTIELSGKAIRAQVERMRPDYDDIIIDVGGRETTSMRAAISVAHICLIPFKPRSLDIWTLGTMRSLISEMRTANPTLKAYAFINQADAKGADNDDAEAILKECDEIAYLPTPIGCRKTFANAASDGLGIAEMRIMDKKAYSELQALYQSTYEPKMYEINTKYVHNMYEINT